MTTEFENIDGCIVVKNNIPLDALASIMKKAPKNAIMDTDLARMLDALIVIGTKEQTESLKKKLSNPNLLSTTKKYASCGLSNPAIEWLANGEQGLSSMAMFYAITGARPERLHDGDEAAHPWDPADLRRCRLLAEHVPEINDGIGKVASLSPVWNRLIKAWDEICRKMDEESPDWRSNHGTCPETYKIMKNIINNNDRAVDSPSPI